MLTDFNYIIYIKTLKLNLNKVQISYPFSRKKKSNLNIFKYIKKNGDQTRLEYIRIFYPTAFCCPHELARLAVDKIWKPRNDQKSISLEHRLKYINSNINLYY